jgi:hypothetical protein
MRITGDSEDNSINAGLIELNKGDLNINNLDVKDITVKDRSVILINIGAGIVDLFGSKFENVER